MHTQRMLQLGMQPVDWAITIFFIAALIGILIYCRRYVKSAADFLAANRCAGRYLLTITSGMAGIGVISFVAKFEQTFVAGFSPIWWGSFLSAPIGIIIAVTGWVYYRLRETRCLTLAQFFEVRYSRNFRIFSGFLGWLSGILNYGIFPAVSVKFFIYFCRLPSTFTLPGIPFEFSTYVSLLIFAIGLGVIFAICGGQVAVMITDFVQGMFCNVSFLLILIYMLCNFSWDNIFETMMSMEKAHPDQSLVNPFNTTGIKDFNMWFFLMGLAVGILSQGSWQGASGYAAAARNAHEAKMSRFLANWRIMIESALLIFIPVCGIVFFNHPQFASAAKDVTALFSGLPETEVSQARFPLFLSYMLPPGFIGLVAAVMFAAMLSTDDTYMHSWGTILVQDVIMPLRGKPFTLKQHLLALRLSIIFVGIFAFFFSWLFRQTEYIYLFFAITGAIFTGGAGALIIGGLYSRIGTTKGAWWAMILGSTLALGSIAVQQLWSSTLAPWLIALVRGGTFERVLLEWGIGNVPFSEYLEANRGRFPINSQILTFAITMISFSIYFIVSFLDVKINKLELFNLDKMLHRGKYDIDGEHEKSRWTPGKFWKILGLNEEFTRCDRIIFFASFAWTLIWFIVFIVLTLMHFAGVSWFSAWQWMRMWQIYLLITIFIGIGTTVWFFVGGIIDVRQLFIDLAKDDRNMADDGSVVDGRNAGESESPKE